MWRYLGQVFPDSYRPILEVLMVPEQSLVVSGVRMPVDILLAKNEASGLYPHLSTEHCKIDSHHRVLRVGR